MKSIDVLIVGAGPAGLTAALELQRAGVKNVTVVEAEGQVGGISKTVQYNGNRIDIGGHRFFSKSDWVMKWWSEILPIDVANANPGRSFHYHGQVRDHLPAGARIKEAQHGDATMMVRDRLSRIYFNERFFDYPLKLNISNLRKLGVYKTIVFGFSYVFGKIRPIKHEKSLEDFFINRFGEKLYRQFFKEYTEKVWGVPCSEISAEWGAQRIKSLSVSKALLHAVKSALGFNSPVATQTSLIESFLYPKLGPGQMWEEVAKKFEADGGTLLMNCKVSKIEILKNSVNSVSVKNGGGIIETVPCTHLISSMPVKDLIAASTGSWSVEVEEIASKLEYRDFITVGLLYSKSDMPIELNDNWIYIQEPGVKVGRVQIFNNWSPSMVADASKVWIGLEFFCNEGDELWSMQDDDLKLLAQKEMRKIKLVTSNLAEDAVVLRVPKAYPGYFGAAYLEFDRIRFAIDSVSNLFVVGRNGMHRYNNQDHSMLTAKEAAEQIVSGVVDKEKIWNINVDDDYHEQKTTSRPREDFSSVNVARPVSDGAI